MDNMNDSDKILFHQWVDSEDATAAFSAWKAKSLKLKSLAPARSNPNKAKRVKPPPSPEMVSWNAFSGPEWDEHVASCRRSGRDPYDVY
jgi:hypothetical protein